ncbi:hypothetical protein M1567_02815 [Candidatus Marsarchaeota archaeon]|nr:hypothetical protein [Candidatus Marsarchaeota archaeon]
MKRESIAGEAFFASGSIIYMLVLALYSSNMHFSNWLSSIIDTYSLAYLSFAIGFSLLRRKRYFVKFSLAALAVNAVIAAISLAYMSSIPFIGNSAIGEAINVVIVFAIIFPALAISIFGFYFIRIKPLKKYARAIGAIILIAAIALFFYYQLYGFGYKGVNVDDETVLSYYAFSAIQAGNNPYSIDIEDVLYHNSTKYGFTLTTENGIVGYLDYPILFVLVLAPFYYLAHGTASSVIYSANSEAYLIFLALAILSFTAAVSKQRLKSFKAILPAAVVFILYFVQILSVQYLIIAIAMIALFYSIDKWYAFAILGIAASLQELLWVPILFALAYIAAAKGVISGVKAAAGAIAVFVAINGYFILENPGIFISHVLAPVNGYLLPFLLSPIPSLLMMFYPLSMHGLELVFYISIAIGVVAVYIARNKMLVASMSLFVYFFLYHTLVAYFALSITMLFFIAVVETEKAKPKQIKKQKQQSEIRELRLKIGYAALAVLTIALATVVVYSHYSYARDFGVSVSYEGITANGTYAILGISNGGNKAINASVLEVYSTNSIEENTLGLSVSQPKHITNMSVCGATCRELNYMNYNILSLLPKHFYNIKILLPSNTSSMRCEIYTKYYYYECPPIIINN